MSAVIASDRDLIVGEMLEAFFRQGEVPVALVILGAGVGLRIPIVKVSYQGDGMGAGSIFSISPTTLLLVIKKPVLAVEI